MSKFQVNTKSVTYQKDKEQFMKDLRQFYEVRGQYFRPPIVSGKELDLYLFYTLVQQKGGWSKVNHQSTWETFLRPLQLPSPCINGAALLRKIYSLCLEKYERARGPPNRDDDYGMDMEEMETPRDRRGRGGGGFRSSQQHTPSKAAVAAAEHVRGSKIAGPSERLALSLLSPLPNEQDFAINVCTLLAADYNNTLSLYNTRYIVDFLLAHAGVYNHSSLRDTIGRSYREARGEGIEVFWSKCAGGGGARELADESRFSQPPGLLAQAHAAHRVLSDSLMQDKQNQDLFSFMDEDPVELMTEADGDVWMLEQTDEEALFAPKFSGGARCVYTQRVIQIANIIRSLSFHDENVTILAKNTTLLRFSLLSANSWVGSLRQSGMDILGNIAQELIIKDPSTCLITRHILTLIQSCIGSTDRGRVLSALELLAKLSHNDANEEVLLRSLDNKVYDDVCTLLTVRDIMLLVCTLECVLALTSLGERVCEHVAKRTGVIATLLSLVTVEAQSYGPKACILMRVVETVSGPVQATESSVGQQQQQTQAAVQQSLQAQQPDTPKKTVPEVTSHTPVNKESSTQQATSNVIAQNIASMSSLQQSHSSQQVIQENEQFATSWLRAAYEPIPSSVSVSAGRVAGSEVGEVYRQYIACCTKVGRKGVISQPHFPRLVRSLFGGSVGPVVGTRESNKESMQLYAGIRPKAIANRSALIQGSNPAVPSSPILKAQLTTKPEVAKPQTQLQAGAADASPSQGVANTSSNNTTLIKHLLAHKVSSNSVSGQVIVQQIGTQHVAQRQQNQQRIIMGQQQHIVTQQQQQQMVTQQQQQQVVTQQQLVTHQQQQQFVTQQQQQMVTQQQQMVTQQQQMVTQQQQQVVTQQQQQLGTQQQQLVTQQQQQMVTQQQQSNEVDPESLIKCNLISGEKTASPGGSLMQEINNKETTEENNTQSNTLNNTKVLSQNKMLTDLLEKKSTPPLQLIQQHQQPQQVIQVQNVSQPQLMQSVSQTHPPVIQITETGQIKQGDTVQVKGDQQQVCGMIQIKNEQGQLIQLKNELGQIIHLRSDQIIQRVEHGVTQQIVQQGQQTSHVMSDHSYIQEPPNKKLKTDEEEVEEEPKEVSKTAANLYAALAASALEDEEDLQQVQQAPPAVPIQQPQQPTTVQTIHQVHQPVLQVQPMDMAVPNIITQGGQIIIQEKPTMMAQQQFIQQQPMQIIATPGTAQGGLSYLQGMQQHKTIIIVQGGGGGTPLTLTVNNPGGLDENTLNTLVTQATEAIAHQQMMQNQSVIQSTQRLNQSHNTSTIASIVKQLQSTGQLSGGQQQMITSGGHKTQTTQQIIVATKPQQVISTGISGNQHIVSSQQILSSGQQVISTGQQQVISTGQQIISTGGQQMLSGAPQLVMSGQQQILVNAALAGRVVQQQQQQQGRQIVSTPNIVKVESKPQKAVAASTIVRHVINKQPSPAAAATTPAPVAGAPKVEESKQQAPAAEDDTPWICHWRGCNRRLENASEVFAHCAREHVTSSAQDEMLCLWSECDKVPRRTFALLNHLHDRHCTVTALKAMCQKKQEATMSEESKSSTPMGYPPNAAIAALNKHATTFLNPRELMDDNEGPVTKSIRLTAALILRNIVIYSNTGRRHLRAYEQQLANIALSSVEASRTVSQILYDMTNI